MHEHDDSLILELLDDPSLSEEAVSARLEGCGRCIADFESQRSMLRLRASLPAPTMTADERRSLRQGVNEELAEPNVVAMPVRARRWEWTRLGTVAAALLGVFVIGGIVTSLGNDAADQADTLAAATSDGATEESAELAAADTADAGADDAARDVLPAEGSGDADVASLAPPAPMVVDLGSVDAASFEAEIRAVSERISSTDEAFAADPLELEPAAAACVDALETEVAPSGVVIADVDGASVVVYFDATGTPSGFTPPGCDSYPLP
jgi:hypothetical protein